jgi:hypothetical protein
MKQTIVFIFAIAFLFSCGTGRQIVSNTNANFPDTDTIITQSLFNDKAATISEESIQKILDGSYHVPQQLRVAIVKLEQPQQKRYYWSDEVYLKNQQSYLDLFSEQFKRSPRVTKISIIPELLISKNPSVISIREAAVRMQADIVVVYSIMGDIYSNYKLFSKPEIKAFATTQVIILDTRTGLIPFSTISTKDFLSQRKKEELDQLEARNRIQNTAVLLTIEEIGEKINEFLNMK